MDQTRREERRQSTVEEIKNLAWQQLQGNPAGELSLRAIAREMRMSSAAIFRYFADRDAVLNALAADAYRSQYETLARAAIGASREGHRRRIEVVATAYRHWALANPEKFALIYGTPVPNYRPDWALIVPVARRSLEVFMSLICQAAGAGDLIPPPIAFTPALLDQLQQIITARDYQVTPHLLYVALTGWMRLHGLVSLEGSGALAPLLENAGDLFAQELDLLLTQTGYRN